MEAYHIDRFGSVDGIVLRSSEDPRPGPKEILMRVRASSLNYRDLMVLIFADGLLPLGINLAVIEYTLAPAARLDRIVAEVRRSVRWLAEHLAEYGGDPNRLYVAGHSAGGHLTAMTMPLAEVRGGIAISGIYDLEPIRLNYLNEKLGLDMAEAERNSPVRHLSATAGELVVAYGTRELPELCRQSIEYGRAWTERGLPGRLLPVDGADHFTILDALARPEGVLTRALLAMLGR
jgi:arylformamidase